MIRWIVIALTLTVVSTACSPIAPWDRGRLAKPQMAIDPYPLQSSVRSHIHSSREAGGNSQTEGGGGCGCY